VSDVKTPLFGVTQRALLLIACDTLLIVAAVLMGARWFEADRALAAVVVDGLPRALLVAAVLQLCLYFGDCYEPQRSLDRGAIVIGIVRALAATSFVLTAVYLWSPGLAVPQTVVVVSSLAIAAIVGGWRIGFEWLAERVSRRDRLLIVGTEPEAIHLARELFERRRELGVDIVGFIDPDPARIGTPLINPGIIGTFDDIPSIVRARRVDRVVITRGDARGKLPMATLLDMKMDGITFDHLATAYEELTGKIAVNNLRPSWLIFGAGFKRSRLQRALKRMTDLAAALIGFALAAPLLALVAAAVKLTSPGPVLYSQQRVGLHGRLFKVYKFRSMRQDAEAASGAVWAQKNDTRVTPVGRFIRKTRLDEIPQLWNVLVGDMSLVGPRPERPEFVRQLTERIPFYGQRHIIRPGLTGWAQVRYSYGASVEDALEKLQHDLFYIKHQSIGLDLAIMLSTIKTVVMRKGAV
jgi:sugar transferase (PEP-CTERM system associated)